MRCTQTSGLANLEWNWRQRNAKRAEKGSEEAEMGSERGESGLAKNWKAKKMALTGMKRFFLVGFKWNLLLLFFCQAAEANGRLELYLGNP